jgi:carbamoyltransferase
VIIFGISEGFHDSSVSVIEDGEILFAAHSERYSKIKNDRTLNDEIFNEALSYGSPDAVAFYDKPLLKMSRCLIGGEFNKHSIKKYTNAKIVNIGHHRSHAAAGYFTSQFDDAVIVVLDAIGEWNTSSVWKARGTKIKPVYLKNYPFSFGLFYSAFTDLIGLKPNEEEYILMGMAAYGDKSRYREKVSRYFPSIHKQAYNFHKGIVDWDAPIADADRFDIAAAVQEIYELRFIEFLGMAANLVDSKNLVLMGGCALNCSANTLAYDLYDNVWIMPNPGDAGSSLGAAAALYGSHLNWKSPYLGTNIAGDYPVHELLDHISQHGVAAVANGRAEFGPRALGNRSLLADPRGDKDSINKIKNRQEFRPFAPVVLEEDASQWFAMSEPSPYMQFTYTCLQPEKIPAVVHHDGTSRVQTVNKDQHAGLYQLLTEWKARTGIPVLLNTSLNVRGMPMVNDESDISEWSRHNPHVKVFS